MPETAAQTTYADGTRLSRLAGGACHHARALCSDGKVRSVRFPRGGHADTFFSVPAVTTVAGKTVSGFISVSSRDGFDTPTDTDPAVVRFTSYTYGRNGHLLP
jgi:hypothetical protein